MIVSEISREIERSNYTANSINQNEVTHSSASKNEMVATEKNPQKLSDDELGNAVKKINKVLERIEIGIEYERHEATNRMMIRVVNKENEEVIKEIPSEEILNIAASICEHAGLFVDEKR